MSNPKTETRLEKSRKQLDLGVPPAEVLKEEIGGYGRSMWFLDPSNLCNARAIREAVILKPQYEVAVRYIVATYPSVVGELKPDGYGREVVKQVTGL